MVISQNGLKLISSVKKMNHLVSILPGGGMFGVFLPINNMGREKNNSTNFGEFPLKYIEICLKVKV